MTNRRQCSRLIFASVFELLLYVLLVKIYEENPASHRYVVAGSKISDGFYSEKRARNRTPGNTKMKEERQHRDQKEDWAGREE